MFILLSGIPGCAKSALCEQILNTPGGLGDNRPLHSLMGDRTKGMEHLATFSSDVHRAQLVLRSTNWSVDAFNCSSFLVVTYSRSSQLCLL